MMLSKFQFLASECLLCLDFPFCIYVPMCVILHGVSMLLYSKQETLHLCTHVCYITWSKYVTIQQARNFASMYPCELYYIQ